MTGDSMRKQYNAIIGPFISALIFQKFKIPVRLQKSQKIKIGFLHLSRV